MESEFEQRDDDEELKSSNCANIPLCCTLVSAGVVLGSSIVDGELEYNPVGDDAMVSSENSENSERSNSNLVSPSVDLSSSESCMLRSCNPDQDPIDELSDELKSLELSSSIVCKASVAV